MLVQGLIGRRGAAAPRHSWLGRFVIKEIELRDEGRRFQERVRLYGADELAALLSDAGLRVTARFGDYDGGPAGPKAPRVILVGART